VAVIVANAKWIEFVTSALDPAVPGELTVHPPPTVALSASCTDRLCKFAIMIP